MVVLHSTLVLKKAAIRKLNAVLLGEVATTTCIFQQSEAVLLNSSSSTPTISMLDTLRTMTNDSAQLQVAMQACLTQQLPKDSAHSAANCHLISVYESNYLSRRSGAGSACYHSTTHRFCSGATHVAHAAVPHAAVAKPLRVDLIDRTFKLVQYEEGWQLQREVLEYVCSQSEANGNLAGAVIILQHPPVYTLGAGSTVEHLRFVPNNSPFPLYRTERGGEVTYHGPGQLVMYPILNLRLFQQDLHWYLRNLEEVVIRALAEVSGLQGERVEGLTGVWVGGSKVAAIGVRASRWVTYHGLALNVTTDLSPFESIVPCGIADRGVTSVLRLLGEGQPEGHGNTSISSSGSNGSEGSTVDALGKDRAFQEQLLREYQHGLLDSFAAVFGVELVTLQEAAWKPPR